MGANKQFSYDSASNKLTQFVLPKNHGNVMSIIKVEHQKDDELVLIKSKMGFSYTLFSTHIVEDLTDLKPKIEKWSGHKLLKFITPKKQTVFEQTLGARFYKNINQKKIAQWMPFAVPAGIEYVFLALLEEGK